MRISALAITTFREEVRRKVFLFLLLFAGVMIATSWIFSFFTGSEELKVVKDMGLTSITLAGVAIAMVMGIRMLPGEMDKRTIYTILCKPVTRSEYLVGKFLGAHSRWRPTPLSWASSSWSLSSSKASNSTRRWTSV